MSFRNQNYKIKTATYSASCLLLLLFAATFFVGTGYGDLALNITLIVFGASIGWPIGIIFSPYDQNEEKRFPKIAATVSAFVTGYLLSKANTAIEALFNPLFLFSPLVGFRASSMIAACVIVAIVVYIYRNYAD